MKIHIGADHAGFEMKQKLVAWLKEQGYEVIDYGAHELDPSDDYPDFIEPVAEAVAKDSESRGIILGGSGQGEAMDANRLAHVRAAEYYGGNLEIVRLARAHNDANTLSLGARFVNFEEAQKAIELFLTTSFEAGCHEKRVEKIDKF